MRTHAHTRRVNKDAHAHLPHTHALSSAGAHTRTHKNTSNYERTAEVLNACAGGDVDGETAAAALVVPPTEKTKAKNDINKKISKSLNIKQHHHTPSTRATLHRASPILFKSCASNKKQKNG